MKVDADGVHLGLTDITISAARQQLGPNSIIGATCHDSIDRAQRAIKQGADYVAFGRFYPSNTKPNAPTAELKKISMGLALLSVPAVAIGGINLDSAEELLKAGFSMLAVIEDIFKQDTITEQCQAYCKLFARYQ